MKKPVLCSALCLQFLLAATVVRAQPGGWAVDPADFQYSMMMVAQIRVNNVPNHLLNNHLAVFSQGQIRGYATPVEYGAEAYYFVNVYANQYKDDTLYFRVFIGADQKVYESVDTVLFKHHLALGTAGEPVQIHLHLGDRPLIYSLSDVKYLAGSCAAVTDVDATDNANSEGNGLTYSIAGGADAARFEIDPVTGLLSWHNFTPDPDLPEDADGDNRYEVDVRVTDASSLFDVQHFTVRVVEDDPAPPGPLICPGSQTLTTSYDGTGDCGTTASQTSISLPDLCAGQNLVYEMFGATSGSGSGQVPANQVFAAGQTTIYYFLTGLECPFFITVEDDELPAVDCPSDQTVSPDVTNPCSATLPGIDAVFSDNCTGSELAFTITGATSGNGTGQAGGQTFLQGWSTLTYTVTDGAGLTATCSFQVTVSDCTANTVISGAVIWENDGSSGVKDANVALTGDTTASMLTPLNGAFSFTVVNGSNFVVKPTKNINKLNGLTTADVTAIQQHITNTVLLPAPFKRIAADVNKSNSITTADVTILNQALVGNPSALNQITSWRFVPAAYNFPNPNAPWGFPEQINLSGVSGIVSGQDFYGIKTGDVVATWANPANFSGNIELVLAVQDQVLESGNPVSAEFTAGQMDDLASFQFTLRFDPERLQYSGIEPLDGALPLSPDHFGMFNAGQGEIRVAWARAYGAPLPEAAPLFRLHFTALAGGIRLSDALRLDSGNPELPGYCYNSAFAEAGVTLHFSGTTGAGILPGRAGLQLFQNRPNPFSGQTAIGFVLPEAGMARLRIFDTSGRLLAERTRQYPAGYQEEVFDLTGVSGALYYELAAPFGVLARRMAAEH